jgi:hypothetical protein
MTNTNEYGWRKATKQEVDDLAKEMDLVRSFHSVADMSLWHRREDVERMKVYHTFPAYARREELYNYDKPTEGYEIAQANVDQWRKRSL